MEGALEEESPFSAFVSLCDSNADYFDDDDDQIFCSHKIADKLDHHHHHQSVGSELCFGDEKIAQVVNPSVRGNVVERRQSLPPRVFAVLDEAEVARNFVEAPFSKESCNVDEKLLSRGLLTRKRFVSPLKGAVTNNVKPVTMVKRENPLTLPPGIEPLVLWKPRSANLTPIIVDPLLVRFLRPHQREGVQFMFDCVSGLRSAANIHGCILADDMGLGKTLQSITLLYTLLCQGFGSKPIVQKAIIVTPTSLVSNWEAEIKKWVGNRVQLIALCESSRSEVVSAIDSFTNPRSRIQVLIVSYETFRMHSLKFSHKESCDLVICDEAHRLKNNQTMTNKALASLSCKRRILLSGTPMQNDLEEFYAMVSFTNPGILSDAAHFRRYYETPILHGREPTATEKEKMLGIERSEELSAKVNQFILRRTNALLSNHLPPKIIEVVCCKLSPLQSELYNYFLESKNVKRVITEEAKNSKILAYITALKKLCNHPKLIYDTIKGGNSGISGFEDCMRFFSRDVFSERSGAVGDGLWVESSGKMHVLARLLAQLRQKTDDRIVLVSNYTQTLDLFAQLCRERRYPYLILDGSISISKRQKLVNQFNDPSKDEFAFLLSSKAGGCGLNLIGGNRLVLFDPDWNPANDKQAAARVWRDGQKKRVYIYRFLSTGTIEEKVYQRQMSKEGLQKVIQQEQADSDKGNFFSMEDLRDLFTYCANVRSEIHEKMDCDRCGYYETRETDNSVGTIKFNGVESLGGSDQSGENEIDIGGFAEISGCLHKLRSSERQVGIPLEEDLLNWGHHFSPTSVPDVLFQASAGNEVTFVFTNQIGGKLVPVESMHPRKKGTDANRTLPISEEKPKERQMKSSVNVSSSCRTGSRITNCPPASSRPVQLKPIRSSLKDVTNLPWKSPPSLNTTLPLKRSCHFTEGYNVIHDQVMSGGDNTNSSPCFNTQRLPKSGFRGLS